MGMKNVIISDEKDLEEKKKAMTKDGAAKLHILSDFDRTITYGLTGEGKRTATVISQLRSNPKYLGQEYFDEAHRLFDIYRPIETDQNIPLNEKKDKMHEWWEKHFDLIARMGLTKELIKKVVRENPLKFRKGSLELLSFLNRYNIPVVFMSAAPGDMLNEYLRQNNLLLPDVFVISNLYEWDKKGRALHIKEPIIHTFNKTEISLSEQAVYSNIEKRKNVILMGDSIGDVGMIEGFDYDNLIKIGFLNEDVEQNIEKYKQNFDVVLTNDADMQYVNKLVGGILE